MLNILHQVTEFFGHFISVTYVIISVTLNEVSKNIIIVLGIVGMSSILFWWPYYNTMYSVSYLCSILWALRHLLFWIITGLMLDWQTGECSLHRFIKMFKSGMNLFLSQYSKNNIHIHIQIQILHFFESFDGKFSRNN